MKMDPSGLFFPFIVFCRWFGRIFPPGSFVLCLSLPLFPCSRVFSCFFVQHLFYLHITQTCKHDDVQVYDDVQDACRRAHQRHEACRRQGQGSVRRLRLVPRARNLHRIGCGTYLFLLFSLERILFSHFTHKQTLTINFQPAWIEEINGGILGGYDDKNTKLAEREIIHGRWAYVPFFLFVLCFAFQKDVQFEKA